MIVWGATDRGMVRQTNQDSFHYESLFMDDQIISVVCDGMGGARSGNVASELAVKTFVEDLRRSARPIMSRRYMMNIISRASSAANARVYEQSRSSEEYMGMGTTLVGAMIFGKSAVISNIGDSRAYLITDEGIIRITRDHSVVEDLIDRGDLTPEEARKHPSKNLITRALGTEREVKCDIYTEFVRQGNYLMLCSDGLTNVVSDQEILFEVLHGGNPEKCCQRLLEIANTRGGPDNITIVLISI